MNKLSHNPPSSVLRDQHREITVSMALICLIILVIFKASHFPSGGIFETDFLTHVEYAKYYLANHSMPKTDWLTWTFTGQPYLITQWLGQIFMSIPYIYGGYQLSAFVNAIMCGLIVIFAWRTAMIYISNPMTSMLIAIFAAQQVWALSGRPQVYGMLVFSILVWMICLWIERKEFWILIAMPAMMAIWVNLHGSYSAGLIYIAATGIGSLTSTLIKNNGNFVNALKQNLPFGISAFASLFATLFNPYGWHAWEYVVKISQLVSSNPGFIMEWSSTSLTSGGGSPFLILIMSTVIAMIYSKERPSPLSMLGFVGIFLFGMGADRQTVWASLAVTPFLTRALRSGPIVELCNSKLVTSIRSIPALLLILIPCLIYWPLYNLTKNDATKSIEKFLPYRAVQFLVDNKIEGRIFNGLKAGGLIESKGRKSFMDGRLDLFGDDFFLEWYKALNGRPGWRQFIDKYDPDILIVERVEPLCQLLMMTNAYKSIYEDEINIVLVKVNHSPKMQLH